MKRLALLGLVFSGVAAAGAPGPEYFAPEPPLTTRDAASLAPAKQWLRGQRYPIRTAQGVTYLYGAGQAGVICAPLRLCVIALEPGEWVQENGLHLGDAVRWEVTPVIGAEEQTQLVVKVVDAGLETNLSVITDRRVYHLRLLSRRTDYMPQVAFHYPNVLQEEWRAYHEHKKKEKERNTIPAAGVSIADLDFGYRISDCEHCAWRPSRVYNNGEITVIHLGEGVRRADSPVLLVLDPAGRQSQANYRVRRDRYGDRYVVDQVFSKALLLVGSGKHQQRVHIEREG